MTILEKTQNDIGKALEEKIKEHGFDVDYRKYTGWMPQIVRQDDSYIYVSIRDKISCTSVNECKHQMIASANVCRMNPNSDAAELLIAVEQIKRGAELVGSINGMEICFSETVLPSYRGRIIDNNINMLAEFMGDDCIPESLKHVGDFVFEADTHEGNTLCIETKPTDEDQTKIKIENVTIIGAPSGLPGNALQEQTGRMAMV